MSCHRSIVDLGDRHAYIAHPARVAAHVAGDENAVAGARLHDVVEDTAVTLAALEEFLPAEVTTAVNALIRRRGGAPADYYVAQ